MIAGHFGLAAAAKAAAPRTPFWLLAFATQWLDVIFVPLFAAGVEGLMPVPGSAGGYGEVIIHADYTHSLVGSLLLSALLGALSWRRYGARSALLVGAVSFSHWLLDVLVHRADMPILPGNAGGLPRLGFALWQFPTLVIALELGLVLVGAGLYFRVAERACRVGGVPRSRALVAALSILGIGLLTRGLNASGN